MQDKTYIINATDENLVSLFIQSRQVMGVSPGTVCFYRTKLSRFLRSLGERETFHTQSVTVSGTVSGAKGREYYNGFQAQSSLCSGVRLEPDIPTALRDCTCQDIELFLIQFRNSGNRHAYFRAIRTFYNWLEQNFDLPSPMKHMKAPRLPRLIMPSLDRGQVLNLIDRVDSSRDKAIIALFTESGLRLSELEGVRLQDINWNKMSINSKKS